MASTSASTSRDGKWKLVAQSVPDAGRYVVRRAAVRQSIDRLANRRSHNHLPGYLALLRRRLAAGDGGMRLRDIEDFHAQYLRVPGAPKARPYIQPFLSRGAGVRLLNRNLQGSYAPSSIRPGQPLSHVIRVDSDNTASVGGGDAKYELVEDHAEQVLSEMLAGKRLLAASLSIFLLRDHALALPTRQIDHLVPALREFLSIRSEDPEGDYIYELLFENDASRYADSDLEDFPSQAL